jgi:hypothetical protein
MRVTIACFLAMLWIPTPTSAQAHTAPPELLVRVDDIGMNHWPE